MSIQAEGTTSESSDMGACLLVLGTSGKPCGWSGVEGWSVSEREMRSELTGQEDAQSTCGLEGLYNFGFCSEYSRKPLDIFEQRSHMILYFNRIHSC